MCWLDRSPRDESRYLMAPQKRHAPSMLKGIRLTDHSTRLAVIEHDSCGSVADRVRSATHSSSSCSNLTESSDRILLEGGAGTVSGRAQCQDVRPTIPSA